MAAVDLSSTTPQRYRLRGGSCLLRTKAWQRESIAEAGHAITVSVFTESDKNTKEWRPAEYNLIVAGNSI
jgi:hypothetical protein